MKKQIREYAIQCIKDEVDAVMELIPQLDDDFERAVELIFILSPAFLGERGCW